MMQPTISANSAGTASPGTLTAGPYEALTVLETGEASITIDTPGPVRVKDCTFGLSTGAAATQGHALFVAESDPNQVRGRFLSASCRPDTAQRSFPKMVFQPGKKYFLKAVQLSGAAAEATLVVLTLEKA